MFRSREPASCERATTNQADFDADYLELPPSLDPRIPSLAGQITAQADNNYAKATAIESYLRTHYKYTLQLSRIVPHDPLAEFLFERKQGHCEYFASSMAVMLRSLGIPSRIVNGFSTGEFNDLTSQYVVRASDAHSWVEAFFPGHGWIAFDPTPGGIAAPRTGWNRMALYLDAMASFWRDWVVNYDASHQQALAVGARTGSRQLFSSGRHWWRRHYESLLGVRAPRRTRDGRVAATLGSNRSTCNNAAAYGGKRKIVVANPGQAPACYAPGAISSPGRHDLV